MKTPVTQLTRRLGLTALLLAPLGGLAQTYTLTDLGPGSANGINNPGKVVGTDGIKGWYYDGLTRSNITIVQQIIGAPPGTPPFLFAAASAVAINDAGRVIGQTYGPLLPSMGSYFGYYQDISGNGAVLDSSTSPLAINSSGLIVGHFINAADNVVAPLPGLPLPGYPTGTGINDSGMIVGTHGDGDFIQAVILAPGDPVAINVSTIIQNLGGGTRWSSAATGVNNTGSTVGWVFSTTPGGSTVYKYLSHGFLYANGAITDLGTLGGKLVHPLDINNNGLIVGTASTAAEAVVAFVYRNGAPVNLNTLLTAGGEGWTLNSANGINDSGVIVGTGTKNGEQRAFLLTPSANNLPPSINLDPQPVSVFEKEPFSLSVTAAGNGTLTYQWKHAGTNLPAATDRTYKVDHATAADDGEYQVIVTSEYGSTPSKKVQVQVKLFAELAAASYTGLTVKGAVGRSFLIQSVEDPTDTNWQTIDTITLTTSPFFWLDPNTPQHHRRLYRAVTLP